MTARPDPARQRGWVFAGAGAAVWAALWLLPLGGEIALIARLLMLAMLVIVPLGLALAATPDRNGNHPRLLTIIQ
jgi:hypothetical protein